MTPNGTSRIDCEEVIRMLCKHYPACFFGEPRQRRPLKPNIAADIIKDADFAVAPNVIVAAVEWYTSHIGYSYCSIAGAKRIDLNGREVGTVTEQEGLAARRKIAEFNESRRISVNPVRALNQMYADRQISDCALKKLDAPPLPRPPASKIAERAPEYAQLFEILTAANATVVGIGDPAMRAVVARTLLDHMTAQFQQARSALG